MNAPVLNKNSKDLNSFKISLINTNLHTGSFGFVREHALCFYPEVALRVSDAVRQSAFFSGANDNVNVGYELETVEDGESGRFVVETMKLSLVSDYFGHDPFITYDLNYMAERKKGPEDMPELRRDGFNMYLTRFFDANKGKHYIGQEEDAADGVVPGKRYEMVAAVQHLRNLLAAIPLSDYRLYADIKPNGHLQLEIWSLDYTFVFSIEMRPGA